MGLSRIKIAAQMHGEQAISVRPCFDATLGLTTYIRGADISFEADQDHLFDLASTPSTFIALRFVSFSMLTSKWIMRI